MKKTALYAGTFDPMTHGHLDIVQRGLLLFDRITVAVSASDAKSPLFSLEERLNIIKHIFQNHPRVDIMPFSGLLVDFMEEQNIQIILRGIRSSADIAHEFQLAETNRQMKPDIETVFLKASPKYAHISSSIIREIMSLDSKKEDSQLDLSDFVPQTVIDAYGTKNN